MTAQGLEMLLWVTEYRKYTVQLFSIAHALRRHAMKQYVVDAFTDKPFSGNPAAVCVMDKWPEEDFMKKLAMETDYV